MLSPQYRHSGFHVLRSPLLPFAELCRWNEDTGSSYATRRAELIARLKRTFHRPELREALFFAVPALERELDAWLSSDQGHPKLERALSAYFTRLTSRETPFGIFAGISLGQLGAETRLELGPHSAYRRHTRLGMSYLLQTLARLSRTRSSLRYEPNNTLYTAFGRERFAIVNEIGDANEADAYPIVDVEASAPLRRALACAEGGATLPEIAAALDDPGTDHAQALAFVQALVEESILVPSWLPRVSGPEPFEAARQALAEHPELSTEADLLGSACERLLEVDQAPIGTQLAALRSLQQELKPEGTARELSRLFQADLVKPSPELCLGSAQIDQLLRAVELIQTTSIPSVDPALERFREQFLDRYAGRWVPLVEALDSDLGLGFDSFQVEARDAWVDDLVTGNRSSAAVAFSRLDQVRLELLSRTLQSGKLVCELDAESMRLFPKRSLAALPDSFAVIAQLAEQDGRFQIIAPSVVAPSAVTLLARFCYADPALEQAVRSHVQWEQALATDRVLADVAYLPSGQAANIVLRPVLRSHEIICNGKSGAPSECQLPLSDLYVGMDRGKLGLRSQRLEKRVSVRITNAHNFEASSNLPVYRFLGALQESDCGDLARAWSWGALDSSPFLPRVTCGEVVLSRARWTLGPTEVASLVSVSSEAGFSRLQELRARLRLPRWLCLAASKGPLVIDLDNCISVELLVHEIRAAGLASLEELLPAPDELALQSPEGRFASEVVLPFVRQAGPSQPVRPVERVSVQPRADALRSFAPGTEWLYVKIFTGPSQLDLVLAKIMEEVLPRFLGSVVRRWFYVPYADPEPHLRVRFCGDAPAMLGQLLPQLANSLAALTRSGSIWKIQVDTYERELERYGGIAGMELAEELFHIDSDAASALTSLCADDPELRWQLGIVGIDRLLADLGFNLPERASLAAAASDGYRQEFHTTTPMLKSIGREYRRHAPRVGALLWQAPAEAGSRAARGLAILQRRSEQSRGLCARLERAIAGGELTVDRWAFASSCAHMHAVRLLGLHVRAYELLSYEFLCRQYATRVVLAARRDAARVLEARPL